MPIDAAGRPVPPCGAITPVRYWLLLSPPTAGRRGCGQVRGGVLRQRCQLAHQGLVVAASARRFSSALIRGKLACLALA